MTFRRFNGRHKCGRAFSTLAAQIPNAEVDPTDPHRRRLAFVSDNGTHYRERDYGGMDSLIYMCPGCRQPAIARIVLGRYNAAKKCNAKCTEATGFKCECECGGKNHGAGAAE